MYKELDCFETFKNFVNDIFFYTDMLHLFCIYMYMNCFCMKPKKCFQLTCMLLSIKISGPEVIIFFVLNWTEHEISTAHKK